MGSFIEIGILPKLDRKLQPKFIIAAAIVADKNCLLLNEVELANLFCFIRKQDRFNNLSGEEVYLDDVINKFEGTFQVNEYQHDFFEILYMDKNLLCDSVGHLLYDEIEKILLNEVFLNYQIQRTSLLIDKCHDELIELLKNIRFKSRKIPDIRALLRNESKYSMLAAEMLANHFDFFSMCDVL